jgi:hypothetical protein
MAICLAVFGFGYYILNHVSRMEKPFLGNTFHIIFGCTLMAISSLLFAYITKKQFFPKKRKRTKQIFLEDITKNKDS